MTRLQALSPYLDCNATTPIEPAVLEVVIRYLRDLYGNAGSRTHEHGVVAKRAVEKARAQVAEVVAAQLDEVVFTSGATESNNIAILGLAEHAAREGKRHIISTAIEHKAVLEPLEVLAGRGFEVELLELGEAGWVDPGDVAAALRPDTVMVSIMQVNNETGVVQPLGEVAEALRGHEAFLHVDAAQGFGKELEPLKNQRIDLISISGHKIYAPKGVGALITRRRDFDRPPLTPLLHGGGQERGLRPGTHPVHLIAGLGEAAEIAVRVCAVRRRACEEQRRQALSSLGALSPIFVGDQDRVIPNTLSMALPGLDSEAAMVALKGVVAASNGSACTSSSYEPSHVLTAMGLPEDVVSGAIRLSWSHLTPQVDWHLVAERLANVIPAHR